ncbi:DNA primase, partial [Candidatus Poribacteria bacterium]
MDLAERVRLENDIVEVISEYGVVLRRSGKSYRGLCPFHNDRNPSFFVSPDKQLFYCFGCGVGGTVIHFVMRYEGISFSEALKKLA